MCPVAKADGNLYVSGTLLFICAVVAMAALSGLRPPHLCGHLRAWGWFGGVYLVSQAGGALQHGLPGVFIDD